MVDASWDNGGLPPQARKKMGTGLKVLLGCGIALVVLVVTCVAGGAAFVHYVKKDPEGFERRMEGWAAGMVQKDWARFRQLVIQLGTDEGALAVYRAQPTLAEHFASEEGFLTEVRAVRPSLKPLPEAVPLDGLSDRHRQRSAAPQETQDTPRVNVNKVMGTTDIGCLYPDGTRIRATFEGERILSLRLEAPSRRP